MCQVVTRYLTRKAAQDEVRHRGGVRFERVESFFQQDRVLEGLHRQHDRAAYLIHWRLALELLRLAAVLDNPPDDGLEGQIMASDGIPFFSQGGCDDVVQLAVMEEQISAAPG